MARISHIFTVLISILAAGIFSMSCSNELSENKENLVIKRMTFSPDYKTADILIQAKENKLGKAEIRPDGRNIRVSESNLLNHKHFSAKSITNVVNLTAERFDSIGMKVLVIVDLTLSQSLIDQEKNAVIQIWRTVPHDNLFVSFLRSGGEITKTEMLTNFILDNRFVEDGGNGDKYLYNGIYEKFSELNENRGPLSNSRVKSLVVLSDGNAWGQYEPFDPNHFETQRKLDELSSQITCEGFFFYVSFQQENQEDVLSGYDNKTIIALCSKTGGLYQEHFNWDECCSTIEQRYNLAREDIQLQVTNQDGSSYQGINRVMNIEILDKNDSTTHRGSIAFNIGNEFFPIVINGINNRIITIRGELILLSLLLIIYLLFQFIVPGIKYHIFLKKNVAEYRGPNMCVNGIEVSDSCYLCKAPFKDGELIVSKCAHTMHKECWDENDYHCPEYGPHCKHGSHYFNHTNLLDPRNAPYYTQWLVLAMSASMIGWFIFYFFGDSYFPTLAQRFIVNSNLLDEADPDYAQIVGALNTYATTLTYYAFSIGVPLVFLLSFLVERGTNWRKKVFSIIIRTCIAAGLSAALFSVYQIIALTLQNVYIEDSVEFVFWILYTFGLALCLTIHSNATIPVKKRYPFLLIASIVVFTWPYVLHNVMQDYRILIVFSYVIYAVLFALTIAGIEPQSHKYVLHAEGCLKTTDIAIYKWFRVNPENSVKIGRSVDCDITLSWDLRGDVAPIQAEISLRNSHCYLHTLEKGVLLDKKRELKEGETIRLYHQSSFTIGTTTFTYRESDLL